MIKRPRFEGKVDPKTNCISCGHIWDTHHEKEDEYDTKCKECFCRSDPKHFWLICDKCHNSDDCWTICEHCGASMCEDCECIDDNRTTSGAEDATDMWWICPICGRDYDHTNVSNPTPINNPKEGEWTVTATKQVRDVLGLKDDEKLD